MRYKRQYLLVLVLLSTASFLLLHKAFPNVSNPKPKVDSNVNVDLLHEIKTVGNIPVEILNDTDFQNSIKCAVRPKLEDIEFSNVYWQILRLQKEQNVIFLYSAYIDTKLTGQTLARIIINSELFLTDGVESPKFCQFWFDNVQEPVVTGVIKIEKIFKYDNNNGRHHPYLLTCPVYNSVISYPAPLPTAVSIAYEMCDEPFNMITVNYENKEGKDKKDFGVCIRGLDFPTADLSVRLIEWIEMLKILGADGIHFHILAVHANVQKVLDYYESTGFVTVKYISLPGYQPNLPIMRNKYTYYWPNVGFKMWRQEVIPYNDCFLKYMYSYKYIAAIDIDEIILPVKASSWKNLLASLDITKETSAVCFEMILFVDRITAASYNASTLSFAPNITQQLPSRPYMMNKLNYERKTVCNGAGGKRGRKCFHRTDNVLMLSNHYPRSCIELYKNCTDIRFLPNKIAYVHHHKESCWKDEHNEILLDMPFGYDDTILKFNPMLMSSTEFVRKKLQL